MLRFYQILIASILISSRVFAGDASILNILGFTKNGEIFAFEEYGTQDGSGFKFSIRHYINTETGQYLDNYPKLELLRDPSKTIIEVRLAGQKKSEAQVGISDNELQQHEGLTLFFNPITEEIFNPNYIKFHTSATFYQTEKFLEIELIETPIPINQFCVGLVESMKRFDLTLHSYQGDIISKRLLVNEVAKNNDGCSVGYRLGGAQFYSPEYGMPILAILVLVEKFGFEGRDHRWLAVTSKLDNKYR